jgi:photosystem II stability/assembly factor-like uncharacterized protein
VAQVGRIGVIALASLVVVDVVLVSFAIEHVRSGNAEPAADRSPLPSISNPVAQPTRTSSASPKPTTTASPSSSASPSASGPVLIDIGSGDAVARATMGSCGSGGGSVGLSTDGGTTFAPAELPDDAAVILRIASTDSDNAWVVAATADCAEVTTYRTSNGGESWDDSQGSAGSWHKAAEDAPEVHAPEGTVDVPCAEGETVTALSTLSQELAYVLCSDGEIVRSRDAGESWRSRGKADGALDLDFVDETTGLAVAKGDTSCAGVAVLRSADAGESWEQASCVETSSTSSPDVSAAGERAYLAVGDTVWYSEDSGDSWQRRE